MKKVFRWIGIVVGGLLGIILLAALAFYVKAKIQFNQTYPIRTEAIIAPKDKVSIEHGEHLADYLCTECHGEDFGGKSDWIVLPGIARISPPNLTSGNGSATNHYTDQDWVNIMRYGRKVNGKSAFIMPSSAFYYLSDQDLADLLAFLKSVPPVDRRDDNTPSVQLTFLGNVLYGAGAFGHLLQVPKINPTSRPSSFPEAAVTAAYGEYLVNINGCRGCHGMQLAGGKPSNPNSPLAPNLTPGGELVAWTEEDFINAIRTGVVPSGHLLNPDFMSWRYKSRMSDDELKAIFRYLQSLPKLTTSTRPAE